MTQKRTTDKKRLRRKISTSKGTDFQKSVWRGLLDVPHGEVWTYQRLAAHIGHPRAIRAVGTAVGKNPFAPTVPCHRIIRSDGAIGNYSGKGGVASKRWLLKIEGVSL